MLPILRLAIAAAFSFSLFGCGIVAREEGRAELPRTPGDSQDAPAFGYTPIPPASVRTVLVKHSSGATSNSSPQENSVRPPTKNEILDALGDMTMRMAVGKVDRHGRLTFGVFGHSEVGGQYRVILDDTNTTTIPIFYKKGDDSGGKATISVLQQSASSLQIEGLASDCGWSPISGPRRLVYRSTT